MTKPLTTLLFLLSTSVAITACGSDTLTQAGAGAGSGLSDDGSEPSPGESGDIDDDGEGGGGKDGKNNDGEDSGSTGDSSGDPNTQPYDGDPFENTDDFFDPATGRKCTPTFTETDPGFVTDDEGIREGAGDNNDDSTSGKVDCFGDGNSGAGNDGDCSGSALVPGDYLCDSEYCCVLLEPY
jgi:hypothetical protein